MKKYTKLMALVTLLVVSLVMLSACTAAEPEATVAPAVADTAASDAATEMPITETVAPTVDNATATANNGNPAPGNDAAGTAHTGAMQTVVPAGELSQAEIDRLVFMREEEKLARDVYQALYEQWGFQVFQNIAGSEQQHMDQVKMLLDAYQITDPVAEDVPGVFVNFDLQALYDQLVAQGSASLADALYVGATVEEVDILDLQDGLAETDDPNITQVYTSLMTGSYYHLQAFTSLWNKQTGEVYAPQLLTQEEFDEIMAMPRGGGH